jgi:hypothetical protein
VIPTPEAGDPLQQLAQTVEDAAARLTDEPGYAGTDWSLQRLVRSLGMWSISIRRLSESGPAARLNVERRFVDHPEHERRSEDPLAGHRAHLDVIAYLTAGDMVLDDLAALLLERRHKSVTDLPWRGYMGHVDGTAGFVNGKKEVADARYLDLLLREARNRLVAHRQRKHITNFAWQMDGSMQLVVVASDEREAAMDLLAQVNGEMPVPTRTADFDELRDWVIAFAPYLDASQRKRVGDAFRLAGYEMFQPGRIVEHVLGLVDQVATTTSDGNAR